MQNSVTVDEALKIGKRVIKYPSIFIFIASIFFSIYFSVTYDNLNFIYLILTAGVIVPFVYKFFVITSWKIWAYENVRNVHQLRQKSCEEGLTYSQDNINIFEFRSKIQKEKLKKLEQKFLQDDVFQDDIFFPKELIIRFSVKTAILDILIWGSALGFGIYIYTDYKGAILLILLSSYLLFLGVRNLINRKVQILINNKGIQLKNELLISWKNIKDEKLVVERNYGKMKIRKKYLSFSAGNSNQYIQINALDISFEILENAIEIYRVRYEKENPN